jgi:hypothetical protein
MKVPVRPGIAFLLKGKSDGLSGYFNASSIRDGALLFFVGILLCQNTDCIEASVEFSVV